MYLLDTNVVCEMRKVRQGLANANVAHWTNGVAAEDLYVSAVTIEELEIGVLRLQRRDAVQGAALQAWFHTVVIPGFAGRVLPVDTAVARRSARLHVPAPCPIRDAFVAATALVHDLTVVTRNVADFERTGVFLVNPWTNPIRG